jgi:hypothetical protein
MAFDLTLAVEILANLDFGIRYQEEGYTFQKNGEKKEGTGHWSLLEETLKAVRNEGTLPPPTSVGSSRSNLRALSVRPTSVGSPHSNSKALSVRAARMVVVETFNHEEPFTDPSCFICAKLLSKTTCARWCVCNESTSIDTLASANKNKIAYLGWAIVCLSIIARVVFDLYFSLQHADAHHTPLLIWVCADGVVFGVVYAGMVHLCVLWVFTNFALHTFATQQLTLVTLTLLESGKAEDLILEVLEGMHNVSRRWSCNNLVRLITTPVVALCWLIRSTITGYKPNFLLYPSVDKQQFGLPLSLVMFAVFAVTVLAPGLVSDRFFFAVQHILAYEIKDQIKSDSGSISGRQQDDSNISQPSELQDPNVGDLKEGPNRAPELPPRTPAASTLKSSRQLYPTFDPSHTEELDARTTPAASAAASPAAFTAASPRSKQSFINEVIKSNKKREHKLKQRNTMLMQKVEVLQGKTGMHFAGFPLSMATSVKILTVVTYTVLFAWDTALSSRQVD